MRIKSSWWLKFLFNIRKGKGLFVKLWLECPVCQTINTIDTTGFEIGKERSIFDAAEEIFKQITLLECRCEECGVVSAIAPKKHREEEIESLRYELNKKFFDALPLSMFPAKTKGIGVN